MSELKLTDYEIEALSGRFNLADGHARYTFVPLQDMSFLPLPIPKYDEEDQEQVEAEFSKVFFELANQFPPLERTLYCPTASISIEIVANYLRLNHLSTALIEPIFDNLADILKRHDLNLESFNENRLRKVGLEDYLQRVEADAVFLVFPNNPTGYVLSEEGFRYLVEFCARTDKLLVLDFSFRFFSTPMLSWSQYKLLEESGVRYIAIEDSGKTWPTFEIKVSPLVSDDETYPELRAIYRDIFICNSPLAFQLVREFVIATIDHGLDSFRNIVSSNRSRLRQVLQNYPLRPVSLPNASVEWVAIDCDIQDVVLEERLKEYGVFVLPGRPFFWTRSGQDSGFIRIALMRDEPVFRKGIQRLQLALDSIL